MSNPREEWIARARKVWPKCCSVQPAPNRVEDYYFWPYEPGKACSDDQPCGSHEAFATGLAQAFYNGVKVGLADLPDEGPVTKRLVEG